MNLTLLIDYKRFYIVSVFLFWIGLSFSIGQTSSISYRDIGSYSFAMVEGWKYNSAESRDAVYVFEKLGAKIIVNTHGTPIHSSQDINRMIINITQNLRSTGEFVEQRKPSSDIFFLGQNQCQRLTIKSRSSQARRFIFLPIVDKQLFQIDVYSTSPSIEPDRTVMYFLALIYKTGDSVGAQTAVSAANKWKPTQPGDLANGNSSQDATDRDNIQNTEPSDSPKQDEPYGKDKRTGLDAAAPTFSEIPLLTGEVIKNDMPLVKFSFLDPCELPIQEEGMPWDPSQRGSLPTFHPSEKTITPPIIPELKSLSEVNYRAAVSVAFESMRLVYGPMPEDEVRKFESAWMPLFDYPTQAIIDYLNKLNPLVSQFLSFRESYIRTLNDILIVLYDAAFAVELDDRYAWEAAMAEAGLYASVVKTIDASMKNIASAIEKLGNPPNPLEAKCEAQKRYRRMLPKTQQGDIGECWSGYTKSNVQHHDLETLFKPLFRHVSKVNNQFLIIELGEVGHIEHLESELDWLDYIQVNQVMADYSIKDGMDVKDGEIRKFNYPNIFQYNNTSITRLLLLSQMSSVSESNENYEEFNMYSNTCKRYLSRSQTAGFFFKRGILWSYQNKWSQYKTDENGFISQDALEDFESEMREEMREYILAEELKSKERKEKIKELDEKNNLDNIINDGEKMSSSDSIAIAEQTAKQESIAFHTEMISVIQHNIERDRQERSQVAQTMRNAKTESERKHIENRIKDLDWRIINHHSNIQYEQDMIASYRTGQMVRTRTAFDDYAHHKFIDNIRENAARMDGTKRIGERMDFLIRLLPEEEQAQAREFVRKNLDAETLASGDIEKAKKIASAIHNQVVGYALQEQARADHDVITAEQNELMAQSVIAITGSVVMGLGAYELAGRFGAQAAATYYGTKTIGAVWGGTTGYLSGGPKEAVKGAMTFWSPLGSATVQFIDGFEKAGHQPNVDISTRVWEGVKSAGTGYLVGKAIQLGASLTAKGAMVAFGENNRLFKPLIRNSSQRSKDMLDQLRTQQQKLNAGDEVMTYQKLETELALLKRDPVANGQKISALESELNQLAAGLNMSYLAKWNMKYKAHPLVRSKFDRRVQANYKEMTPGMVDNLDKLGYDMKNIEFRSIRNSSSAGSSSMDLDFVPYHKGTNQQMKSHFIRKKNGSIVSLEQFQYDAQNSMNAEYRKLTGLNAKASDMQVTTAIHMESYTTTELLKSKIDFSKVTDEDLKSVAKVLDYKMEGIDKKVTLTHTTKMQAKAREASKEIENMLLAKLRSDLSKAPPGSAQQKQMQSDIRYWEDMLARFKTIGTNETNPSELMKLNRDMMHETGGRDVNGVINDLIGKFK